MHGGRVRGRPPVRPDSPHGEQEVRRALVEAGRALFCERGVRGVTVKEVARTARVNHGLVHHYFGSKDGLVSAVLDDLAHRAAEEIASYQPPGPFVVPGGAVEQHGRLLGHLVLEGTDPRTLMRDFPGMRSMVERMRARGVDDETARRHAVQACALVLGWQFFGEFLVTAADLDADDQPLLEDALARLLPDRSRPHPNRL